jgi:hypothetical protein
MVRAQVLLGIGERTAQFGDRVGGTACRPVGGGQVASRCQRLGVAWAEQPLAVGDRELEVRDRVPQPPG